MSQKEILQLIRRSDVPLDDTATLPLTIHNAVVCLERDKTKDQFPICGVVGKFFVPDKAYNRDFERDRRKYS